MDIKVNIDPEAVTAAVREKAAREQSLEIVGDVVAVLRDYLPNDYGIKIETRTKD